MDGVDRGNSGQRHRVDIVDRVDRGTKWTSGQRNRVDRGTEWTETRSGQSGQNEVAKGKALKSPD